MGKESGETVKAPGYMRRGTKSGLEAAKDLYQAGPLEYFGGQTYADFDPLQLEGLSQQEQFARSTLPQLNQQLFGSFGTALDASNIVGNPAVQAGLSSIEDRAMRNFGENILPQLRQQATGTGNMFSSKAEQSERLAGRDLQGVISDAQANLLTGSIGDAMGLQKAALGFAPSVMAQGTAPGSILGQVGGAFQGMDQNAINEAMARFNFGQQAPIDQTNQYINQIGTLGGMPVGSTQGGGSSTTGNVIGGALLGNSLAGATGGLGAFGGFPLIAGGALLGGLLG